MLAYLHNWQKCEDFCLSAACCKSNSPQTEISGIQKLKNDKKSTIKVSEMCSLWHELYSNLFKALRDSRFVRRTDWNYLSCIAPDNMSINFPQKLTFILSEAAIWIKGSQVSFWSKWQFLYYFMSFFNDVKYWGGRWRCFDQWRRGAWQLGMMNRLALWHESEILNNWFKKETSDVRIQKSGHQCQ